MALRGTPGALGGPYHINHVNYSCVFWGIFKEIAIYSCCVPVMDSNRHEDSGEMYSPDDQREYMPLDGAPRFSMQGLSDALADVREGITEPSAEEYTMMLEVMMANLPGQSCPPMLSWNVGMVMHILKNDPVLRELEHVQVDSMETAYLFFYDKQGCCGLGQDTAYAIWAHMEEAFSEWISHSTHFAIGLLPLVVGCCRLRPLKAEGLGWEPHS